MSTRAAELITAFNNADKDGSETLTRKELLTVLKENGMSASKVDNLMRKLDLNGDGIITLGEYKVALEISSQPLDAWKQMFEDIDKDGTGAIDAEELKTFLRQMGSENLQDTIDAWMEDYDTNKDGKLSYREFLGFVASLES